MAQAATPGQYWPRWAAQIKNAPLLPCSRRVHIKWDSHRWLARVDPPQYEIVPGLGEVCEHALGWYSTLPSWRIYRTLETSWQFASQPQVSHSKSAYCWRDRMNHVIKCKKTTTMTWSMASHHWEWTGSSSKASRLPNINFPNDASVNNS